MELYYSANFKIIAIVNSFFMDHLKLDCTRSMPIRSGHLIQTCTRSLRILTIDLKYHNLARNLLNMYVIGISRVLVVVFTYRSYSKHLLDLLSALSLLKRSLQKTLYPNQCTVGSKKGWTFKDEWMIVICTSQNELSLFMATTLLFSQKYWQRFFKAYSFL